LVYFSNALVHCVKKNLATQLWTLRTKSFFSAAAEVVVRFFLESRVTGCFISKIAKEVFGPTRVLPNFVQNFLCNKRSSNLTPTAIPNDKNKHAQSEQSHWAKSGYPALE
jgi:hypothetical protein